MSTRTVTACDLCGREDSPAEYLTDVDVCKRCADLGGAARSEFALSPREQDVLELIATGMTVPAIGRRLYMSPSTVRTYLARLNRKLGAENRAHALVTAAHAGLI